MSVRIASYNLFEGAGGSYNRLVEFVRAKKIDVICLQEVNGWQDGDFARLKDFTDKILFTNYAYGNTNTEYKLATVSKPPITARQLHAEAFWHAALETRIMLGDREVSVINLHLDPWKEESRLSEITRLLNSLEPGRPAIITGDFNSISRQDNYPPQLLDQLRAKGISKYGMQALEFSVIDKLLQSGFVDVFAAAGNFNATVPSAFNNDKEHEVPVRIDYIFITRDLAPFVTGVECDKSDLTDTISDHYPLIVTFDFEAAGGSGVIARQQPAPAQQFVSAAQQPISAQQSAPISDDGTMSVPHAAPWQPDPDQSGAPKPADDPPATNPHPTPWVPPEDPAPKTAQQDSPKQQDPPKPKDDEVVMWSHEDQA